jgi:hypothetical protein
VSGTSGTVSLTFDANGLGTLTCVTPTPTATPTPTPTPHDGNSQSCADPTSLGQLSSGQSVTHGGTGPPPASADWFEVTSLSGTLTLTLTPTDETGVVFDVYTDCITAVAGDLAVPYQARLASAGTYYIKVYVLTGGTNAGTFELAASDA